MVHKRLNHAASLNGEALSAPVPAARRRAFVHRLLRWGHVHGRRDFPWQQRRTPYRVWVSEVMLQQTRAVVVVPYFQRFMRRFPGVIALARASEDEVLRLWTGLGYYGRARNLHRSARLLRERHGGRFPRRLEELLRLPGIGRSTAGAVLGLAYNLPATILDGNVRRVLCRYFLLRAPPGAALERRLWELAEALVPERDVVLYTQTLMDLGATVCTPTSPDCARCPLKELCLARRRGCQRELPLPRPRHAPPTRRTIFLVLRDQDGRLLLERCPPSGVWGGLWCFPKGPPEGGDAAAWCSARFHCKVVDTHPLPEQRHTFSHYRLHAELCLLRVVPHAVVAADSGSLWLRPELPPPVGLAAAVRRALPAILKRGTACAAPLSSGFARAKTRTT